MFFREGAVGGLAGGQEEVCTEGCHFASAEFFSSQERITVASDALFPYGRSGGLAAHGPGRAGGLGAVPGAAPGARRAGRGARGGAARAGRCPPALIDTGPGGGGSAGTALLPPAAAAGQRVPRPPPPPRSPAGIAVPPAAWPARWAGGRRAGGCGARRAAGRRRRRAPSPSPGTVRGRPRRGSAGREPRGPRGAASRPTCLGLVLPGRGWGSLFSFHLQRVRRERSSLLPNSAELRLMSFICRGERRGTVFERVLASCFDSGFFDNFCRKHFSSGKRQ